MTIRGKAAIVGIGEVPTRRSYPDRTTLGLCAEAARMAIEDAGLRKADINGLVTDGGTAPAAMAEYINLRPTFATGVAMQGASGTSAMAVAASAVLANNILSNTIGLEAKSSAIVFPKPLPNGKSGILIVNSTGDKIGDANEGNLISGNLEHGIAITSLSSGTLISHNQIGIVKNNLNNVAFVGNG